MSEQTETVEKTESTKSTQIDQKPTANDQTQTDRQVSDSKTTSERSEKTVEHLEQK